MPSPWAALPVGADVRDLTRRMRAAREGFFSTGQPDAAVRRVVLDSWRRCLARGNSPHAAPPVDLADQDLREYRDSHPLAPAMPAVHRLLVEDAMEAGLLVALTDAAGRLLWVEGSPAGRRRAEQIGFAAGAIWSEDAAGTNAPGTSLALDHPVQIFAAEHFAGPVTAWSCSAAPIHAPDGSLLGAVDLTGGDHAAAPVSLTLVRTVAAVIEAELRARRASAGPRSARTTSSGVRRPGAPAGLQLRLLGHPTGQLINSAGTTGLRLRHAEILLLLTLNPSGLTAEQLSIELHDRVTAPVTLRAELSRLRDLLARHGGGPLASRPYRLLEPLDTDVAQVRRLLQRGAYRRALASYPGPVLPESVAPGVEVARERLRAEVRACLLAGGDADLLWTYANSSEGSHDLEIWQACGQALPPTSRRLPVVHARRHQLLRELG